MPGQDYNRPTTTCCAELLQEREAAHAWHSEIHEEAAGSKLGIGIEKRLPRVERLWLDAGSAKEMIEPLREVQIVVHYIHDHRCDAHAALRTFGGPRSIRLNSYTRDVPGPWEIPGQSIIDRPPLSLRLA